MKSSLHIQAGSNALTFIRQNGLHSNHLQYIAGAAGGPKWLVLSQLDRAIFGHWIQPRKEPLYLVGSSIGAWRFAAAAQRDPLQAIDTFERAYIEQSYSSLKPSPAEVSTAGERLLEQYLPPEAIDDVLSHPFFRINVLTVKCKNALRREDKASLLSGFALASASNAIHPRLLHLYFERFLLHDPRDLAPLLSSKPFSGKTHHLTSENLKKAILASGSIPGVMQGVVGLDNHPTNIFRDGGLLDYHLNLPYHNPDFSSTNPLVLFPHYSDKIKPNWFDKNLPWRKHSPEHFKNVIVISPSKTFLQGLPLKRIPDRNDFYRFKETESRVQYWKQIVSECQRLHDDFLELMLRGGIAEQAQPLI